MIQWTNRRIESEIKDMKNLEEKRTTGNVVGSYWIRTISTVSEQRAGNMQNAQSVNTVNSENVKCGKP